MGSLEFAKAFGITHAALAGRLAGVAPSLFPDRHIMLGDATERDLTGAPHGVALTRCDVPSIGWSGKRANLGYADPASEASFAALIALICGRRGPVAADPQSLSVLALANRIAAAEIPVLINGPTGTGKEVLSRFIHARSARSDKPFIAVNCAAIPETMLEAMLFGHQKGAFTGASHAAEGFFRAADGGTLLLDEIAEMPLNLQAKLLRALQEGEVVPVGATSAIKVDVRIIACANRDLPLEVEEGRFRADLFYRLNVFPLALSALRERPADIAPLAFAMALRHTPPGEQTKWIGDDTLALLKEHGWAGNIRELENVIRRALVLAHNEPAITPEHIVFDRPARLVNPQFTAASTATQADVEAETEGASVNVQDAPLAATTVNASGGAPDMPDNAAALLPASRGAKLSKIVQLYEARAIMETLTTCGGRRVDAARKLGISERTLRYRLASFREAGLSIGGSR